MDFSNPFETNWIELALQWADRIWPALLLLLVGLWVVKRIVRVLESLLKRKNMG